MGTWYWKPRIYYRCIDISISALHSPFSFHASGPTLTLPQPYLPSYSSSSSDTFVSLPSLFLRYRLLTEGVPVVLFSSLIHQPFSPPNIEEHMDAQQEHINQWQRHPQLRMCRTETSLCRVQYRLHLPGAKVHLRQADSCKNAATYSISVQCRICGYERKWLHAED